MYYSSPLIDMYTKKLNISLKVKSGIFKYDRENAKIQIDRSYSKTKMRCGGLIFRNKIKRISRIKLKMVYTLYKLLKSVFPLLYGFGMIYISLAYELCAPRVSPLIC